MGFYSVQKIHINDLNQVTVSTIGLNAITAGFIDYKDGKHSPLVKPKHYDHPMAGCSAGPLCVIIQGECEL